MDLYLLRHATAVDIGAPGVSTDSARYLSQEGIAETKHAAEGLLKIAENIEAILTSPYPRASQTAKIAAKRLGLEDAIAETDLLEPGATLEAIAGEIERRGLTGDVMIVGHNPDFEEMILDAIDAAGDVNMKKGGLAIVRFDASIARGRGQLRALLTCKHLRLLGGV
jgi:phosphohistidine phosphatase